MCVTPSTLQRRLPDAEVGVVERVWYDDGLAARAARAGMWPFSQVFRAAANIRLKLYDAGILRIEPPVIPTISVGNLTVGGTGKTPFAAWLGARLSERATPAIALRGYGSDEIEVHRRLNPHIPIVVNADRAAAVREARSRDCDVVLLDDAYQHLRAGRSADIVLLSAEQMVRPRRLLPAGPWREPLESIRRATLLVVTRKSATPDVARRALDVARGVAPDVPAALVHLAPHALVNVADRTTQPIDVLRGASVVAIAAIGEPTAFAEQLEQLGAAVSLHAFRDHHAFSDDDIRNAAERVAADGFALCTLKDAVKLAGRWPGPSRLWYVSQQLVVEQGAAEIDRVLQHVLAQRATTAITAG